MAMLRYTKPALASSDGPIAPGGGPLRRFCARSGATSRNMQAKIFRIISILCGFFEDECRCRDACHAGWAGTNPPAGILPIAACPAKVTSVITDVRWQDVAVRSGGSPEARFRVDYTRPRYRN